MKSHPYKGYRPGQWLITLTLIFSGFTWLSGPASTVKAAAAVDSQWQDTSVTLDNAKALVCVDGLQANTLLVSAKAPLAPGMQAGSYTINWKTGVITLLNPLPFDVCNSESGLAYGSTNNGSIMRFSSLQPQGQQVSHMPAFFARDGSLQFYATNNAFLDQPLIIYASSDGGLSWQERPRHFEGKYNQMAVAQTDARAIYVITCPDDYLNDSCKLFFSADAGLSWEDRGYPHLRGTVFEFQSIPGHNTPRDNLLVKEIETGLRRLKVSNDGGRTFHLVAEFSVNDSPHGGSPSAAVEVFQTSQGLLRRSCDTSGMCKLDLSSDNGYHWQPLPALPAPLNQSYRSLIGLPNTSDSFLAVDYPTNYLWLSKDAGQSWQKIAPNRGNVFITPYAPTTLLNIYKGSAGPVSTLDLSQADQSLTAPAPVSGATNSVYFNQTSHNLAGVFHQYWQQKGGLAQFGYPHTEAFREANPADGKVYTVQYYERNRFEYHPEKAGTAYEILLGLLGNEQTAQRRTNGESAFRRVANPNLSDFLYFEPTGHTLAHTFRQYWEAHGGLAIYGYPVSEEFQEVNPDDGKTYTVQYFERNRFEYHSGNKGTPYEVLLGLLGNTLLKQKGWL